MTADTQLPTNVPCSVVFVIYWCLFLQFNTERLASCVGIINLHAAFQNVWTDFSPPKKIKDALFAGPDRNTRDSSVWQQAVTRLFSFSF